jgi:murein DD-endopeptidase MepM/ murein hydrolase activator NlpD
MSFLRGRRSFFVMLTVLALVLAPAGAGAQTQDIEDAEAQRADALARYRSLQEELDAATQRYAEIWGEHADLTWRIAQLEDRITDYEREVASLRDTTRAMVLDAYKQGGGSYLGVAFQAGSIQDVLTSQEILSRAADRDFATLDHLEAVRREMDRLKVEFESDRDSVTALVDEAEGVVSSLDTLRIQVQDEYRAADAELRSAIAEYEEEQRRIRLARIAASQGAAAGLPSEATPGFVCPVTGTVSFINDWGFPRSGGRTHKGNDIFAPHGTPLVASEAGTVNLRTSTLGGISVYVNTNHGISYYYAHLSAYPEGLATGDYVSAGQVVGYVGTTGNAIYSPPHLHFGIYANGRLVNPYPSVAANC